MLRPNIICFARKSTASSVGTYQGVAGVADVMELTSDVHIT